MGTWQIFVKWIADTIGRHWSHDEQIKVDLDSAPKGELAAGFDRGRYTFI